MKFRDVLNGKTLEKSEIINEGEMKFQALSMAKAIHTKLASTTFIDGSKFQNTSNDEW